MKGLIAIDKLIKWIIAILVLVLVLMFFFGNDIIGFLGLLPDYSLPESQTIDMTGLSEDELSLLGCTNIIGTINDDKLFLKDFDSDNKILIGTNLKWDDETKQFYLGDFAVTSYVGQEEITVKTGLVDTNKDFGEERVFLFAYEGLPLLDELYMLHNSQRIKGTNYLCKTDEQIENDFIERQERVDDMVSSGKSDVVRFVFDQPFFWRGEDNNNDAIDVYWDFEKESSAVRVYANYNERDRATSAILRSSDEFENIDENILDKLSKDDKANIKLIFNSENPAQMVQNLKIIFDKEDDDFYAVTSDYEYDWEDVPVSKMNNLFYGVDDISLFVKGEKFGVLGTASKPFVGYSDNVEAIRNKINVREEFYYSYEGDSRASVYDNYRFYYDADAKVAADDGYLTGLWRFDSMDFVGRGAEGGRVTQSLVDGLGTMEQGAIDEGAGEIMKLILEIETPKEDNAYE